VAATRHWGGDLGYSRLRALLAVAEEPGTDSVLLAVGDREMRDITSFFFHGPYGPAQLEGVRRVAEWALNDLPRGADDDATNRMLASTDPLISVYALGRLARNGGLRPRCYLRLHPEVLSRFLEQVVADLLYWYDDFPDDGGADGIRQKMSVRREDRLGVVLLEGLARYLPSHRLAVLGQILKHVDAWGDDPVRRLFARCLSRAEVRELAKCLTSDAGECSEGIRRKLETLDGLVPSEEEAARIVAQTYGFWGLEPPETDTTERME